MDRATLRRALVAVILGGSVLGVLLTRLPLCPMAGILGVPCPGCGLTRATLALCRGDFRQALRLHPLVLLIAPIFSWAIASAALEYVRGTAPDAARGSRMPHGTSAWLTTRAATALAGLLLALTFGVWGARFLGYFGGPAPVQTYSAWARCHGSCR